MSSRRVIVPVMLMSAVLPPSIRTPVAPGGALSIEIVPPSMVKLWLEFTVTATPLLRMMEPPPVKRMLSGPLPVALRVVIGVVRAVETTTSAMAPEAAIKGAIATAVASIIRIQKNPCGRHAQRRRRSSNRDHASLPQVSRI